MARGDRTHTVPNPRRDQWHVTVGRALGRATRATAEEIDIFRRNMARARASFLPETRPRRPLPPLLEKLGEVVSRHADQGFVTLRDDPVFWALIHHIHASRPTARAKPTRRRAAKRAKKQIAPAGPADQQSDDESVADAAADAESVVDAVDDTAEATGDVESVLDAVAEVDGAAEAEGDVESVLDAVAEVDGAAEAAAGDETAVAEPESGEPGSGDAQVDEEDTKEQPQ